MSLREHPVDAIRHYVPEGTAEDIIEWLHTYKIHLKIRRERKTILGDYRPAHHGKPHTISVNANLNAYHFLITLVHELAHLINYLNHGRKALPHGKEWKAVFALLLSRFTKRGVFPPDILKALEQSMGNLAASTCSDVALFKVLRRYDEQKSTCLIDELQPGDRFRTEDGRRFEVHAKRRTRFECREIPGGRPYLFPSIYEVYKE